MKDHEKRTGTTEPDQQTYRLMWQGIEMEARYTPLKWNTIAHLEIETVNPARARLPITDTGYLSHFHPIGTIEREYDGDVIKCVREWLDARAKEPAWKRYVDASRQVDLFG